MKKTLAVPNAILFILDPTNEAAVVPVYVPGEAAAATPTCVSIATIADVDGEVTVSLGARVDDGMWPTLVQVFDGLVETPGHVLAVVTAEFERVLEMEAPSTVTRLTVRVDDVRSPIVVCVVIVSEPQVV
jgi:hypothetical protein